LLFITESRIKIKQAIRGPSAAPKWRRPMRKMIADNLPVVRSFSVGFAAFCLTAAAMLGHGALTGAGPFA
jgi:hypothetical protein